MARPTFRQRAPRLPGFDYRSAHWYFITVVTRHRRETLGGIREGTICLTALGRLVTAEWRDRPRWEPGLTLDLFVVMPNHLHAILALPGSGNSLLRVVGRFNAATSARARRSLAIPSSIWQRSFFDRVIRNRAELDALRKYIVDNPAAV
jgi:REP element-mobilizing transposase RayT